MSGGGESHVCSPPQPLSAAVRVCQTWRPPVCLKTYLWQSPGMRSPAGTPPLPLQHLALEIWPYMGPSENQQKGDGCQNQSDNILKKNAPPSGPGKKEMGFPALAFTGVFCSSWTLGWWAARDARRGDMLSTGCGGLFCSRPPLSMGCHSSCRPLLSQGNEACP